MTDNVILKLLHYVLCFDYLPNPFLMSGKLGQDTSITRSSTSIVIMHFLEVVGSIWITWCLMNGMRNEWYGVQNMSKYDIDINEQPLA